MTQLVINPPLADQLRALAEREKRPVDKVLADLLARYPSPLPDDELNQRLVASGVTLPLMDDSAPPPISPEEELALADEIGRAGPLSALIIEERNDSP